MSCLDCFTVTPLQVPEIDIIIPFGTTPVIRYTGKGDDGNPYDFTGKDLVFKIYNSEFDKGDPIFEYLTAAFIVEANQDGVDSGVLNQWRLFFKEAELDLLRLSAPYFYRVQMIDNIEETVLALMRGGFTREFR